MTDIGILARDSVARPLNREALLLFGGTAALLMQVAHPLVAAGVKDHSDFRPDPLGRLRRTLNTTLGIVFGTIAQARAGVGAGHAGLHLSAPLRAGARTAERRGARDYWAEARFVAGELGATREALPATYDALIAYAIPPPRCAAGATLRGAYPLAERDL